MKFTSIAIDDELYALKDLEQILYSFNNLEHEASFNNGLDAITFLIKNGRVNLVFCDIEMPNINGLEAAQSLVELCDLLVFTTAHEQYAKQAYELGALGYLSKPVEREEVKSILDKLGELRGANTILPNSLERIIVKDGTKQLLNIIELKDVFCFLSHDNYVKIETGTDEKLSYNTLDQAEARFCAAGKFIRISRTTIVAKDKIDSIKLNKVILSNGKKYSIGKTFRKAFFENFYKESYF